MAERQENETEAKEDREKIRVYSTETEQEAGPQSQVAAGDGASDAEPRKPATRILEQEIEEGLGEIERPAGGLFLSGLSAGLDVGFSLLLMAVTLTAFQGEVAPPVVKFLVANSYAIGFIFVVVGRSELFTEHTALATLPVLNGQASLRSLVRLWVIVYVANILGGTAFALLTSLIAPALGAVDPAAFGEIARHLVEHQWWIILMSGVLAGWLMGLLSWLVAAGRDTISQIFVVWLVATTIGFIGLHHAIVGTVEVLAGLFSGQGISVADFGHFLLWTTLGNSIGGVVFVAAIKYSHVIRSGQTRLREFYRD